MLKNLFPQIGAFLAKWILRILLKTCRVEIHGLDYLKETAKHNRCILMLWHNRLAMLPEILHKFASEFIYCAFVSKSRDGELLAILAESYSSGSVLRVPHNARHFALNKMIEQLKEGKEVMVITPDGPRGPKYKIKPGIVLAAKEADAKIIPVSWNSEKFWQLNTWDRLIFPKPFSRLAVQFGAPIDLTHETHNEEAFHILQDSLGQVNEHTYKRLNLNEEHYPK